MDEIFENKNLYIHLLINKIHKSNQMHQFVHLVCAWESVFRKTVPKWMPHFLKSTLPLFALQLKSQTYF